MEARFHRRVQSDLNEIHAFFTLIPAACGAAIWSGFPIIFFTIPEAGRFGSGWCGTTIAIPASASAGFRASLHRSSPTASVPTNKHFRNAHIQSSPWNSMNGVLGLSDSQSSSQFPFAHHPPQHRCHHP